MKQKVLAELYTPALFMRACMGMPKSNPNSANVPADLVVKFVHDARGTLTAAKLNLELLKEALPAQGSPPESQASLEQTEHSIARLEELLSELHSQV